MSLPHDAVLQPKHLDARGDFADVGKRVTMGLGYSDA